MYKIVLWTFGGIPEACLQKACIYGDSPCFLGEIYRQKMWIIEFVSKYHMPQMDDDGS